MVHPSQAKRAPKVLHAIKVEEPKVETKVETKVASAEGKRRPQYILKDGTKSTDPTRAHAVDFLVPNVGHGTDGEKTLVTVNIADLSEDVKSALLAFGLQTALTNAINTANKEVKSNERFHERLGTFKAGAWSNRGGEGKERDPATRKAPLLIRGIARSNADAGRPLAQGDDSWNAWAARFKVTYFTMTKEKKAEFDAKWSKKAEVIAAMNQIKLEESQIAVKANAAHVTEDDMDDLA